MDSNLTATPLHALVRDCLSEDAQVPKRTKNETTLAILKRAKGASIADIEAATGWQPQSVRAWLSTYVKKLGLELVSESNARRGRVYRVREPAQRRTRATS